LPRSAIGWDVVVGPVAACGCPQATLEERRATKSRATVLGIRSYAFASMPLGTGRAADRRRPPFGAYLMAASSGSPQR
jgi:hypothetical protein